MKKNRSPQDEELLRLLRGGDESAETTAEEAAFWEQVLDMVQQERPRLEAASQRACARVVERLESAPERRATAWKRPWLKLAAAAALVLGVGGTLLAWQAQREEGVAPVAQQPVAHSSLQDILAQTPAGATVLLTEDAEATSSPLRIAQPVRFSAQEQVVTLGRPRG